MAGRRTPEDVELNVASMLDMAFQLLTFFILTFRPPPVEEAIAMKLPPPQAWTFAEKPTPPPPEKTPQIQIQVVKTLPIRLVSQSGGLDQIFVGETRLANLQELDARLKAIFADKSCPFEQVVLQASYRLRYTDVLQVMGLCSEQTLQDGKPLGKLSLVAMDGL